MPEFYYLLLRESLLDRDCYYQHFTVMETQVVGSRTEFREQHLSGLIGNLWPSHRTLLLAFIASLASSPSVYLHRPMLSYWTDLRQMALPFPLKYTLCFWFPFFFFLVIHLYNLFPHSLNNFFLPWYTFLDTQTVWLSLSPFPLPLVLLY